MDNALSFSRLAPLLAPYRFLSVDLSGHGLSSWRSPDASYNLWDDVPQLMLILDQLDVDSVLLMGHSRGAGIGLLLASILAERCIGLVLIDGLLATYHDDRNSAQQLARSVRERKKYVTRSPRYFDSIADFVAKRGTYGFDGGSAEMLAPRTLEKTDRGWRLRSDPRLFGASPLWYGERQRAELYGSLRCPTLAIKATEGLFSRLDSPSKMLAEAEKHVPQWRLIEQPGNHHLHMDDELAPQLAAHCLDFFAAGT
jgi:pimeloyl-ACP methyl ester carboxylesterase